MPSAAAASAAEEAQRDAEPLHRLRPEAGDHVQCEPHEPDRRVARAGAGRCVRDVDLLDGDARREHERLRELLPADRAEHRLDRACGGTPLNAHPKSEIATPVKRRRRPLISRLGTVRLAESCRATRRPEATSTRSSAASSFGMSSGSFCRSPSIVTIRAPSARASPACIAGCWPKLRLKRTTRTRGSRSCSARSFEYVSSVEPSSTKIASQSRPSSVAATRVYSSSTAPDSFNTVTTTETSTYRTLTRPS